jgi:hypothetical protein
MRKNIIIAGLVVWNLILMAALIYIWANWRRSSEVNTRASPAGQTQDSAAGYTR